MWDFFVLFIECNNSAMLILAVEEEVENSSRSINLEKVFEVTLQVAAQMCCSFL